MNLVLLLVAVALVVAVAVFALGHRRTAERQWQTTDEMMQWLADQAVDDADKSHGIKLDYSLDSIKKVDEVLGRIHDEYVQTKSMQGVQGISMAYGAYIGECIKKSIPGSTWDRDHPVGGEKSYPLNWLGGESFPCGWSYKRIVNGPEDNVWHKFLIIRQRAEQGTEKNSEPPSDAR